MKQDYFETLSKRGKCMTSKHHGALAKALLRAKPERGKYQIPVYLALYRGWKRCLTEIILTLEQDSQSFNKQKFVSGFYDKTDFN